MASNHGTTVLRGASDLHVGMSELCLEWNDLEAAANHLRLSDSLGDLGAFWPRTPTDGASPWRSSA